MLVRLARKSYRKSQRKPLTGIAYQIIGILSTIKYLENGSTAAPRNLLGEKLAREFFIMASDYEKNCWKSPLLFSRSMRHWVACSACSSPSFDATERPPRCSGHFSSLPALLDTCHHPTKCLGGFCQRSHITAPENGKSIVKNHSFFILEQYAKSFDDISFRACGETTTLFPSAALLTR